jgi:hypothetical protein
MRLAGLLLALLLASSTAGASPLPFEIVRMLPETNQVLIFDRAHNTHVLLQPGSKFDEYVVIEVSGIDMIVEKQQERFTVYPREAKFLALNVLPREQNAPPQPPVIYGRNQPAPAATVVATTTRDAKMTNAKTQVAQTLSLVLTQTPLRATPRTATAARPFLAPPRDVAPTTVGALK